MFGTKDIFKIINEDTESNKWSPTQKKNHTKLTMYSPESNNDSNFIKICFKYLNRSFVCFHNNEFFIIEFIILKNIKPLYYISFTKINSKSNFKLSHLKKYKQPEGFEIGYYTPTYQSSVCIQNSYHKIKEPTFIFQIYPYLKEYMKITIETFVLCIHKKLSELHISIRKLPDNILLIIFNSNSFLDIGRETIE
jgi:hypothetical protein